MTVQDLADMAAACDRLLCAADTSLARIAIPLLHVINEHPANLAQYGPLPVPGERARRRLPLASVVNAASRVSRALIRSTRRSLGKSTLRGAEKVDVLIVSRLLRHSQLASEHDLFFGDLQRSLRERGLHVLRVFVNHVPGQQVPRELAPVAGSYVLQSAVGIQRELSIWRQCAVAGIRLRRHARQALNPLDRRVALLASRHAALGGTVSNLRLHVELSDICRRLNPRIVITTCEGAASERMIWHAARASGGRPLCVGYQHTRILAHAHALRRSLPVAGMDCDPDVILTSGEIPHDQLAESPGLRSVRLIRYGSHRRSLIGELPPLQDRARVCLVLPDAEAQEIMLLLTFTLACASQVPETMFLFRPHPAVATDALLARVALPRNVALSAGTTLTEDCLKARYCLYRGSSAAMHAVLAGVRPFYVAQAGEMSFDPLFALESWREIIASPAEFISRARWADEAPDADAARRARNFCDRYVSLLRPRAIDELLALREAACAGFTP